MHGQKNHPLPYFVGYFGRNLYLPVLSLYKNDVIVFDVEQARIQRMNFEGRIIDVLFQFLNLTGAGHGVPLVPNTTGCQNKRKLICWLLRFVGWLNSK